MTRKEYIFITTRGMKRKTWNREIWQTKKGCWSAHSEQNKQENCTDECELHLRIQKTRFNDSSQDNAGEVGTRKKKREYSRLEARERVVKANRLIQAGGVHDRSIDLEEIRNGCTKCPVSKRIVQSMG